MLSYRVCESTFRTEYTHLHSGQSKSWSGNNLSQHKGSYAASKGSGEPAHKCSLFRAFAVRRQVVGTFRKLQAKTHVCSPNRSCAFEESLKTRSLSSYIGSFLDSWSDCRTIQYSYNSDEKPTQTSINQNASIHPLRTNCFCQKCLLNHVSNCS